MRPSSASPGGLDNWTCDEMTCWVLPLLQPLQCNVRIEPKLAVGSDRTDDNHGNKRKKITGTFLGGHLSTEVFILCHCEECSQLPGYKWIETLPSLQQQDDNDNAASPSSSSFFMPPNGIPLVANGIKLQKDPYGITNAASGGPIWTASQWEKHSGRGRSKKWKESTRVADSTDRTTLGWIIDRNCALEVDHGTLVGKYVAVYFVRELAFYTGQVVAFNKSAAQHWIKYDDGDNEWLDLGMEHFYILDNKDKSGNEASGSGGRSEKEMVAINVNANPAGVIFRKVDEASVPKSHALEGVDIHKSSEDGEGEGVGFKTDSKKKGEKKEEKKEKKNKIVPAKKRAIVTPSYKNRKDKEPASKEPHVVSLSNKTSPSRHGARSSSDFENDTHKKGGVDGLSKPSISLQSFQIQIEEMYDKANGIGGKGSGSKGAASKRKRQNNDHDGGDREEDEDGRSLIRDEEDRDEEEQSPSESSVVIEISSEESDDEDDGGGVPRFRLARPLINDDDKKKKTGGNNNNKREMDPELLAELEEFLNFKKVPLPSPTKAADNGTGGTVLPTTTINKDNGEKVELLRARIREEIKEEYTLAATVFDENQAKSLRRILALEQELAQIKENKKDSNKQKRDAQREGVYLRRENDRLKREVAKENELLKKALAKSEDQVKLLKKELIELGNDH